MKKLVLLLASVLLALSPPAEAQHPDHVSGQFTVTMYEADLPHVGGVFSWRKGLSRNWALTASYMLTTSTDPERHFDHITWVSAERSFGRTDRTVPYVLLGSAGFAYHTLGGTDNRWLFSRPGVGGGIRRWSADRTCFVASEAQFNMNALLTLNVAFGFGL